MAVQKVAVVGAGASGLTAIKCCLDEGVEPVCFERTDFIGQWDVKIREKDTDNEENLVFDAVLVCTGHHADKNIPEFPGLSDFEGKVIHSHDYKTSEGYEDKNIVIIGIGNSGGDAAVELGRVANQLYLSTRRGSWVLNRVADNGMPIDMLRTNRKNAFLTEILPFSFVNSFLERQLNQRFDHVAYSLKPKHRAFSQHPTMNDDLPNRIICGSVIVKPDIKRFTKNGVEFVDGTRVDNLDVVFLATGYTYGFPFLDKSIIDVKNNECDLYKFTFPPHLAKPTLSVIGYIQPLGAIMPISELQCRLSLRIFKGEVALPTEKEMRADIAKKHAAMAMRYTHSQRHTIQVDWIPFMDELAELNGCKPNIGKLLWTDPFLALRCVFGPCTPYQYRLFGTHKWQGAREAIMTQWDRTLYPLKTRPLEGTGQLSQSRFFRMYFILVILFAIFMYIIQKCYHSF
ncbi:hypothetical protein KUTeg_000367 [Tegillarca granosa]|uniref:Flavin-containing monooxygenase n=1 Tax=Tegillarca granosa TaxID=220873 RepID=A0ABQ9G0F7_TEGGR|nr:hypothetical protein KUTeg_000367 [Tegillarca granosa]